MDGILRPCALLRHDDPRVGAHDDLLLSLEVDPPPQERCVLAWRISKDLASIPCERSVAIEPIEAHRAYYLRVEGRVPLAGDRGSVELRARGMWRPLPNGAIELVWAPHAPPMVVRLSCAQTRIDANDPLQLATATVLHREL